MILLLLWLHAKQYIHWVHRDKSVKHFWGEVCCTISLHHTDFDWISSFFMCSRFHFVKKGKNQVSQSGSKEQKKRKKRKKERKPSWNHSFTLTWLHKMYADKPEIVLVTFHVNKCSAATEGERLGDYDLQLDFYLITHKVNECCRWKIEIFTFIFPANARNHFSKDAHSQINKSAPHFQKISIVRRLLMTISKTKVIHSHYQCDKRRSTWTNP